MKCPNLAGTRVIVTTLNANTIPTFLIFKRSALSPSPAASTLSRSPARDRLCGGVVVVLCMCCVCVVLCSCVVRGVEARVWCCTTAFSVQQSSTAARQQSKSIRRTETLWWPGGWSGRRVGTVARARARCPSFRSTNSAYIHTNILYTH